MISKIIWISFFVTVCVRSSEEIRIDESNNDYQFYMNVNKDTGGIVPILLTNRPNEFSHNEMLHYFGKYNNIVRGIRINENYSKVFYITNVYLKNNCNNYPLLTVMRDGYLIDRVVSNPNKPDELKQLYDFAMQNPPPRKYERTIAQDLYELMKQQDERDLVAKQEKAKKIADKWNQPAIRTNIHIEDCYSDVQFVDVAKNNEDGIVPIILTNKPEDNSHNILHYFDRYPNVIRGIRINENYSKTFSNTNAYVKPYRGGSYPLFTFIRDGYLINRHVSGEVNPDQLETLYAYAMRDPPPRKYKTTVAQGVNEKIEEQKARVLAAKQEKAAIKAQKTNNKRNQPGIGINKNQMGSQTTGQKRPFDLNKTFTDTADSVVYPHLMGVPKRSARSSNFEGLRPIEGTAIYGANQGLSMMNSSGFQYSGGQGSSTINWSGFQYSGGQGSSSYPRQVSPPQVLQKQRSPQEESQRQRSSSRGSTPPTHNFFV